MSFMDMRLSDNNVKINFLHNWTILSHFYFERIKETGPSKKKKKEQTEASYLKDQLQPHSKKSNLRSR